MEDKEKHKKVKLTEEEHAELLARKAELEDVKKQFEAAQGELAEFKDKFLRAYADFENAKKRLAKEKADIIKFAGGNLMRGLLPILDNLERALSHASQEDPLKEGVSLIRKQLLDLLARHGLKRLEAVGKKFDPHYHEAIGHVESAELPEDTVAEELEPGYMLEERLLRPAKVRIVHSPKKMLAPQTEAEKKPEEQVPGAEGDGKPSGG